MVGNGAVILKGKFDPRVCAKAKRLNFLLEDRLPLVLNKKIFTERNGVSIFLATVVWGLCMPNVEIITNHAAVTFIFLRHTQAVTKNRHCTVVT